MNNYQDKLMEEVKELERKAREQKKLATMTPEQRSTYWIAKSLVSEGIYWAGRYCQ
jgi:hypothetical protein